MRATWLPDESALQINSDVCLSHSPADIPHVCQGHLLSMCKKHDFFFPLHIPTSVTRGLKLIFLQAKVVCPWQRAGAIQA